MEKRIFENVMDFLRSYDEDTIQFGWNSYGGGGFNDIEWEYGWNSLGRKKIPVSIDNIIKTIVEEHAEPIFENVYSETDAYLLNANFYPKEKKVELTVSVEEYVSEDRTTEDKLSSDKPVIVYMKENGIDFIECRYDGSGDSGEINYFTVDGRDENLYMWERDEKKFVVVETLYTLLENNYSGWEIDEGSAGTIELSSDGSFSISHSWNTREWFETGESIIITSNDFN